MIVGIDEVGRGPWAGPLVVGAVVLGEHTIAGLTDSKKLSKIKREELSKEIIMQADAWALGWVDASELDRIGLSASLALATRRALEQIHVPYHEIIIDGTVNFLQGTSKGQYVTTIKQADLLISAVSAASIIAKVARDDYMSDCDTHYPGYGFGRHVGYGTAAHKAALVDRGVTQEHRKSFAPIAKLLGNESGSAGPANSNLLTTKQIGSDSESAVAKWLQAEGCQILEQNWKTKFCEIDIIAQKNDSLLFLEVKHRKNADQGGGIAAITPKKLRQMRFAASLYLAKNPNQNAQLAVVSTTGVEVITVGELLLVE